MVIIMIKTNYLSEITVNGVQVEDTEQIGNVVIYTLNDILFDYQNKVDEAFRQLPPSSPFF